MVAEQCRLSDISSEILRTAMGMELGDIPGITGKIEYLQKNWELMYSGSVQSISRRRMTMDMISLITVRFTRSLEQWKI